MTILDFPVIWCRKITWNLSPKVGEGTSLNFLDTRTSWLQIRSFEISNSRCRFKFPILFLNTRSQGIIPSLDLDRTYREVRVLSALRYSTSLSFDASKESTLSNASILDCCIFKIYSSRYTWKTVFFCINLYAQIYTGSEKTGTVWKFQLKMYLYVTYMNITKITEST